ncbi:MAG: TonB-dependent receptor [Prolixibacteraceae bacterium]|nr:TonB-dependent receptor [Prolixibacteraceae bacterium]
MNQKLFQIILLAFCALLYIKDTYASINDTVKIEEVVVTGTKTKRALKQVPARVDIINAQLISEMPLMQTDDLLRFTPGVNINRSTGIYSQRPMVTLRGLSGDEQARTLVLLNGIPINTSDEGGVNWNRINQNDIERIEVFKGPGSSLYGNNAMGGVINIITKKPKKSKEAYASISYGTFNTKRQDLGLSLKNDNGYYAVLSQYYLNSDGYNNMPKEKRSPYDIARTLEETGLSARVGNEQTPWFRWELQYDIFRDKRGEGYQVFTPSGCYRNFDTNFLRGALRGGNTKTQYDFNVFYQLEHYYDVNERMRGGNYSRYDVDSYRKDYGALFSLSHNLFDGNTLTIGFELKQGSVAGGDYYQTAPYDTIYNQGKIRTYAGYIQDEYTFWQEKITMVAGLRFDNVQFLDGSYYTTDPWDTTPELTDNSWNSLSPRLGFRFNLVQNISAYINYSHGFRVSILDDLTRTGWMWVGPKYANPNLGPESLDNFEAGIDYNPGKMLNISATVWLSKGDDFLYYVSTGDSLWGRPISIRENVTGITSHGVELDAKYRPTTSINMGANYTFSQSNIDQFDERPELEGKSLKYAPIHSASFVAMWFNDLVNITCTGQYKGKQYSDDANSQEIESYTTFDIMFSKRLMENITLSLDIRDIFNNQHLETAEYLSPGRLVSIKASIKL